MTESRWFELRFYISRELLNLAQKKPVEAAKTLYKIKRELLLAVLNKHGIEEFVILDEIREGFILLRVSVARNKAEFIMKEIIEQIELSRGN